MTALPQHTLPLATTSPFTPRPRASGMDSVGWGNTFDRALQGMSRQGAFDVATLPMTPTRSVPLSPAARTTASPQDEASAGTTSVLQAAHRAVEIRGFDGAETSPLQLQASRSPYRPEPADPPDDSAHSCTAKQRQAREFDPTPVRVHVERHSEGLAIWIGADAFLGSEAMAALVRGVRRAQPNNDPLASLVCNGRTVYASPRPPKENP